MNTEHSSRLVERRPGTRRATGTRARAAGLLLAGLCAATARADTGEAAGQFVQSVVSASIEIAARGAREMVESNRARYRRELMARMESGLDAREFGLIALGRERYEAAFTGTGPGCVYTPEALAELEARYGELVRRELAELALAYTGSFDAKSFRAQTGQPAEPGRYVVRATVVAGRDRRRRRLAFSVLWNGERFKVSDASLDGESLAAYVGSGQHTLFDRNGGDPASALRQRGLIERAADYRPELEPGETRCR